MRINFVAIALASSLLLGIAGCRRKPPADSEVAARASSGLPTLDEQTDDLRDKIEDASDAIPDEMLEIPESEQSGWQAANTQTDTISQTADARFENAKTLRCEAETIMKWYRPDGEPDTLQGLALILVEDSDTYRLEYYLPESGAHLNKVYANDGKYAIQGQHGVKHERPRMISGNVSADDLNRLADTMAKDLIAVWLDGGPGIDPIIDAYRRGVGGYRLSTETRTVSVDGKDRKQHRYYAETDQGTPTEVEIVLDGEFFRPVTMRVTRQLEDGITLRKFWRGKWYSGGTHGEKEFSIPPPSSS